MLLECSLFSDKEDANDVITTEQMTAVAKLLGENWKKLASELGFSGEDIADFEEMPDEKTGLPAAKMIFLWQARVLIFFFYFIC